MKTNGILKRLVVAAGVVFLGAMISCEDTNPASPAVSQTSAQVSEESTADAYFQDVDDMTGVTVDAVSETDGAAPSGKAAANGRRIDRRIDDRFGACAVVTVTVDSTSTWEHPRGVITIDFGSGCTDPDGNTRKGKIIITFDGRKFMPGSVIVITFDNYSINKVKLEGVRTLTNLTSSVQEAPKFEAELDGGKATDTTTGQFITRDHCFIREWQRAQNPLLDGLKEYGCPDWDPHAFGTMRNGQAYEMTILEPLLYKRRCPIAVAGKKQIKIGDKTIIVDYGDGGCDRAVVVTMDGETQTVDVE